MKTLKMSLTIVSFIVGSFVSTYALEQSPTGFYYPTGRAPINGDVGWLGVMKTIMIIFVILVMILGQILTI